MRLKQVRFPEAKAVVVEHVGIALFKAGGCCAHPSDAPGGVVDVHFTLDGHIGIYVDILMTAEEFGAFKAQIDAAALAIAAPPATVDPKPVFAGPVVSK